MPVLRAVSSLVTPESEQIAGVIYRGSSTSAGAPPKRNSRFPAAWVGTYPSALCGGHRHRLYGKGYHQTGALWKKRPRFSSPPRSRSISPARSSTRAPWLSTASTHEATAPAANLIFDIQDSRGNKVFKKVTHTDEFGVASADFALADEVNLGNVPPARASLDGAPSPVRKQTRTWHSTWNATSCQSSR